MSNSAKQMKKDAEKSDYPYPSYFGSHRSMVVDSLKNDMIICEDENGKYLTEEKNLDNNCADPYRYMTLENRKKFFNETVK